jgi:hypothetical protein
MGAEFVQLDLILKAWRAMRLHVGFETTFGEVIAEARKKAYLTQRQLAAHIKNEEGKAISGSYLADIEHNLRHPPRGYLLEQFAQRNSMWMSPCFIFWRNSSRSILG